MLTESGFQFTPEFERDARVDSVILDWQHTVEEVTVFGEKHEFKDARFKPLISLTRIFGIKRDSYDSVQNRLIDILSAESPNILLIHGHGAEKQGRWIISTKGFGEKIVDVEDFLRGPIKDLTGKNKYTLIAFDACSANSEGVGTYNIPQWIVDEIGCPIYYVQGISGVLNQAERVLIEPTDKRLNN
ncbi:MAG: hypothetical protein PVJ09_01525 [Candidatus Woesebacteria bacterium]